MSGRNVDTNVLLEALREYKKINPYLRLGQILSNISKNKGMDVFYLPDEILLEVLKEDITSGN